MRLLTGNITARVSDPIIWDAYHWSSWICDIHRQIFVSYWLVQSGEGLGGGVKGRGERSVVRRERTGKRTWRRLVSVFYWLSTIALHANFPRSPRGRQPR